MSNQPGLRILCLDGGDARCMSQLYILEEYMHRLEHQSGNRVLPCEHFDLIAAVDSSSPIAVFLGLFRMPVEDAQKAFLDVYTAVFKDEKDSPDARSLSLENEIKKLLDACSMPYTKRMSDFPSAGSSKVALCYSPAARLDSCKFFRNYRSPTQVTQNVTVIEALRVAWAIPGMLPTVPIGPKGLEEAVMSAGNGFGNPIREVIKEAYQIFGAKTQISYILNIGSGFRGVVNLDDGNNVLRGASMDCDRLARDVTRNLARLRIYYRLSVDHGLEGWGPFRTDFGAMKSHVDEYLGRDEPSGVIDHCIAASFREGGVSLDKIYAYNAQEGRSEHGLPPLSAFFVMRQRPMDAIIKGLTEGNESTQRIMVISGLGGSGKTQLALKFARDFRDSYRHILFVDASSADRIEKGLISRVRSMRVGHPPTTISEALDVLSNTDVEISDNWFIIFDNADDPETSLPDYFPTCEHGSILITTRNPSLGNLTSNAHLELGSMDEDEAVEVLLSAAFPVGKITINQQKTKPPLPTARDREAAVTIAKELDCLPIAIVQAGCYIQQHKALHQYLDRLRTNRSDLLQRTSQVQRDKLKYPHGVYASFDIVLHALSPRALKLLGVISFFHFSNFPRRLFAIAANSKFAYECFKLLDRPPEFQQAIQLLKDILCPQGEWSEGELDKLLEDLQKFSLVTMVPMHNMITLRFHPLAHNWAQDRLSAEEKSIYRAAAVRLFMCGITECDDHDIQEYLEPHLALISTANPDLHVNDQAAASLFPRNREEIHAYLAIWRRIHAVVEAKYSTQDIRTSRALLLLADAYGSCGDRERMESMERSVIATRETIQGRDHPETAAARANLARTFRDNGKYLEAESLEKEVLQVYIHTWGFCHQDTAQGMEDLATTYGCIERYKDAEGLLSGVVAIRTRVNGRASQRTIGAIRLLADFHYAQGRKPEGEAMMKMVLLLKQELYGEQHLSTVESMKWLAHQYYDYGQYQEAEKLLRIELETRNQMQGGQHIDTLYAMRWLGRSCFELKRYEEAEELWKEELAGRRATQGDIHSDTLVAMWNVAQSCFKLKRYKEAEELWREELAGRRATQGDTNSDTLNAIGWVARFCFELKRYKEAEELWREELAGRRATQGDIHSDTLNAIGWVAQSCFELGRYKEAEELRKEELTGRRATQGDIHSDTLYAIGWVARSCFELKRYKEAEDLWREELAGRRATQGDTHSDTLDVIRQVAQLCFSLERYKEAAELRREELAGCRATQGDTHSDTLNAMLNVAQLCFKLKQYKEVEELWREELASRRATHGDTHINTLCAIGWLARSCSELEQYKEAEELWRDELAGRRATQGATHSDTLNAIGCLAQLCFKLKRYKEAEDLWREELAGRRATQGDTHSDTLNAMLNVAQLCFKLKKYEKVEELWREELASRRATHGDTHIDTLDAIGWVARACFELGQYKEAEELWREQLAGHRATRGDTHSNTLEAIGWVAQLCFELKRYKEAEELWREELAGRRATQGDTHSDTLDAIGWVARSCFELKRYNEAEELRREELVGRRATQGDTHSDTLDVIGWVARSCFELKRYKEAEELQREELAGRRATQGNTHIDTLNAMGWVAQSCFEVNRYGEAEQLRREKLAGHRATQNDTHIDTRNAMRWVAVLFFELKQYEEAEELWKEALASRQATEGDIDISTLNEMGTLARSCFKLKRYKEAEDVWLEELAGRQAIHGNTHIDTLSVVSFLAGLYEKLGRHKEAGQLQREFQIQPDTSLSDMPMARKSAISIAHDDDDNSSELEAISDPGGDPTYYPSSLTIPRSSFSMRPQSPLNIRTAFGNRPNSWSML